MCMKTGRTDDIKAYGTNSFENQVRREGMTKKPIWEALSLDRCTISDKLVI